MPELVKLLDRPAVSYGKGAIVGVAGEMEHGGACVHPMQHYDDIGVRNTLDLSWIYDESLKPAHLPEGAARGAAIKEAAG